MLKLKFAMVLAVTAGVNAKAFDLEDYATTYRATRDAYAHAYLNHVISKIDFHAARLHYRFTPSTSTEVVDNGAKTQSCGYMMESSLARNNRVKITQELNDIISHPLMKNWQSQMNFPSSGLTDALGSLGNFYSKLDPGLNEVEDSMRHDELREELSNHVSSLWSAPKPEFDPEDMATRMREKRDTYLKYLNELKLATPPFHAAKAAYLRAYQTYLNYVDCGDYAGLWVPLEDFLSNANTDW